jgi:hypothetical protein
MSLIAMLDNKNSRLRRWWAGQKACFPELESPTHSKRLTIEPINGRSRLIPHIPYGPTLCFRGK